jgi:hypothetical protein
MSKLVRVLGCAAIVAAACGAGGCGASDKNDPELGESVEAVSRCGSNSECSGGYVCVSGVCKIHCGSGCWTSGWCGLGGRCCSGACVYGCPC